MYAETFEGCIEDENEGYFTKFDYFDGLDESFMKALTKSGSGGAFDLNPRGSVKTISLQLFMNLYQVSISISKSKTMPIFAFYFAKGQ